ncbi:MAG: hypothetical protein K2R93_18855 [Gemmatimonadaceae bacterium]|nr:hypothetical protein [Gemmatimonadaceae bacterium]
MSGQLDLFAEPCSITMHRLAFSDREALDAYLEPWQQHPDPAIRTRVGRYLSSPLKVQYLHDPVEALRIEALECCAAPLESIVAAHSDPSPQLQSAAFASLARRSGELERASDDLKVAALLTLAGEERRAWRCWRMRPLALLRLLPEARQAEVIARWLTAGAAWIEHAYWRQCEGWICHGRFRSFAEQAHTCDASCRRRRNHLADAGLCTAVAGELAGI